MKSYLDIKSYIENVEKAYSPSLYWQQESDAIAYMRNATPEILNNLRDHCHWLTGIRSHDYRDHHKHKSGIFEIKYRELRKLDVDAQFVEEPLELGGFGFKIENKLMNLDTLKFYESVIALRKANLIQSLGGGGGGRPIIVEIGAGWGGFAHVMKSILPNCQYVVVDLPNTLLFSGTYLGHLYPQNRIKYVTEETINPTEDLIFCTNTNINNLKLNKIDLAINMVSFQEMKPSEISSYMSWLKRNNTKALYSHNRETSNYNIELKSVSEILINFGELQTIDLLSKDYTQMKYSLSGIEDNLAIKTKIKSVHRKKKNQLFIRILRKLIIITIRLLPKSIKQKGLIFIRYVLSLFNLNITSKNKSKSNITKYKHIVVRER